MSVRPTGRGFPHRLAPSEPYHSRPTSKKVHVGNLAFECKWEELRDFMRQAGSVVKTDITIDQAGRSRGYGFVEYSTFQEAEKAITSMNGSFFMGRNIHVTTENRSSGPPGARGPPGGPPRMLGRKLYINNLAPDVVWQELKDFLKTGGNVVHANVLMDPSGNSKGCGIAEFATPEDALNALTILQNKELRGQKVYLREDRNEFTPRETPRRDHSFPPPDIVPYQNTMPTYPPLVDNYPNYPPRGYNAAPMMPPPQQIIPPYYPPQYPPQNPMPMPRQDEDSGKTLYVGNLPYSIKSNDLKDHFSAEVAVHGAEVAMGEDGRSRGFGTVELRSIEDVDRAIQIFNNSAFKGRQLNVRIYRPGPRDFSKRPTQFDSHSHPHY